MVKLSDTFHIGNLEVAALSDGAPERALGGFFHGVDAAEWTRALGITDPETPVPFNFGSFLIRGGTRTVLIDTGYGTPAREMGMEGGGGLLDRIRELGVGLDEIDMIVHTHLHGDHVGWNLDADGAPTFPKAVFFVSRVEMDYWLGSEADANPMAAAARRAVSSLQASGRVATFDGEIAVTTGLTTVPTPGHTPGHTSLLLASQGEHLLIAGDAAHHPAHLEHHDWIPGVDLDPAESHRSRQKLAELAVEKDAIVTGGHFPILTLGKLERVESGYRWKTL
ncbi:MAG: MBL fold metallo-hydrolase [Chloroflexi bacterium]|nr:MBL fold metallo-hydrolase [Chloroflexota bacterium]MDA1002853.1 MBL fold metallo-hydrolase [Chloroflexota bacterium]